MSSLDSVIATPELLEAILLQLDPRTLLVSAPLVSHYFHDVITNSIALQKALFFVPDASAKGSSAPVMNPLLLEPFRIWFHPSGRTSMRRRGYSIHSFNAMDIWRDGRDTTAFMRTGASWRRMLVQQPAPTALAFASRGFETVAGSRERRPCGLEGTVGFSQGLTMGALYDIAQERLGVASKYTAYYFRVVRSEDRLGDLGPDMIRLLEDHGIVYEERGYYPCRVPRPELDDHSWDQMYRHPDFEEIEISLESKSEAPSILP